MIQTFDNFLNEGAAGMLETQTKNFMGKLQDQLGMSTTEDERLYPMVKGVLRSLVEMLATKPEVGANDKESSNWLLHNTIKDALNTLEKNEKNVIYMNS